jgi:hypothetical protein
MLKAACQNATGAKVVVRTHQREREREKLLVMKKKEEKSDI